MSTFFTDNNSHHDSFSQAVKELIIYDRECFDSLVSSDNITLQALYLVIVFQNANVAFLQRKLLLGYTHAKQILSDLEKMGVVERAADSDKLIVVYSPDQIIGQRFILPFDEPNNSDSSLNRDNILSKIDEMATHGHDFERLTKRLLLYLGFSEAYATQGSGDFGIDVLAKKDGISYAIQCKCYSSTVGNKAVQEAYSGKDYYHCMVAAVLTNNYFTDAAKETAQKNNVLLWDRNALKGFIKKLSDEQIKGLITE